MTAPVPRAHQPHWDVPASVDATFTCARLRCTGVRASACIYRQRVCDAQTTCDAERGQASDYLNCRLCPQGAAIRDAFDPEHEEFQGVGPGGRRERARTLDTARQAWDARAARARKPRRDRGPRSRRGAVAR